MYEILVEEKFDAAHCLRGYPGNCEKLHGHTYKVQVALRTPHLGEIGMAVDFRSVKSALRTILKGLDHTYINELPEFSKTNPTAENLACYIYGKMKQEFAQILHKVTVWETESSAASYWEE
ncbi:MAG TPA: 6-carboxytetrahydropterin synthase QueD [Armatimonadota bacterium]|nr:6-carboxytetrahydropterin synthase QueD [Armatimonadota bacterium]HOP81050.1 6-carboxytetrahydropterin synthase QueD [Armatimonadota bacterium]HPP75970.1 6-carboxytetrahydropterin synthase QueD [Armatimonadota bacterium]